MTAPSKVIGGCARCGEPSTLTAFAHTVTGEPEVFDGGEEGIIWVSPGLCRATMGQTAKCEACGEESQLRILVVEELKLPMSYIPVDNEEED